MTIVYRTAGAWGAGKGSRLTASEVDGNFYDHEQRIAAAEAAIPAANKSIDTIDVSGALMTITYTDTTTDEFLLPMFELQGAGAWLNNTSYSRGDVVTVGGDGAYLVLVDHTTPVSGSFDPDAVDVDDNQLYALLFPYPTGSQYVQVSGTTYTLSAGDSNRYLRCTNAGGCEVTFPDDGNFPANMEVHFRQGDDGPITFVEGGTSVVLNPQRDGYDTATPWKGATVTAKYLGDNEWDLIGTHGDAVTS